MSDKKANARRPAPRAREATARPRPAARAPRAAADGDTEQRILDAAHEVFLRRGTAGARMQDIAAEAGVNHALLHYYFRSKERLARAVFQRAIDRLLPPVLQLLASDLPLEEKVGRVVQHELEHLARAPYLPGYVLAELNQNPDRAAQLMGARAEHVLMETRRPALEVVARQIDERVRAGTMRRIAQEDFIVNLVSLCIFPFAARPMIATILEWDRDRWNEFIERRRTELPRFFLEALRP